MLDTIKKNKKLIINCLLLISYAVISFLILIFHEPWRDEAQQWLIVRDLDIGQIISQMKYEGHFVLWYMILFPFVKLGFPYITANIISWIICVISVYLIIFKSPLKTWVKILFIFSLPLIYYYPVISRCYCLIPLAISLIAITYKNRKQKPINYMLSIILLLNTHVIMLGLVGILILLFFIEELKEFKHMSTIEKKKFILSLLIGFILGIISILPLFKSASINEEVTLKTFTITQLIDRLIVYFDYYWYNIVFFDVSNVIDIILIIVLTSLLILLVAIYECNRNSKYFLVLFISMAFQFSIYIFLYIASQQRLYSLIFIILLIVWIQNESIKQSNNKKITLKSGLKIFIIIIIFMLNVINGLRYCIIPEIKHNYSSSKDTAIFINSNLPSNSIILSNNIPMTSSIIPYTNNIRYYNIIEKDYFTYSIWNGKTEGKLNGELFSEIKKMKAENLNTFYILIKGDKNEYIIKLEQEGILAPIFESRNSILKEEYIIYDICL